VAASLNAVKVSSVAKGLTKRGIVTAALQLLDEVGMDGLTVRALADRLDVKAPALYWHVRDKAELVDEMATEVWRGVADRLAAIPAGSPWQDELRGFCEILRAALLAHRDGAKAFSGTYMTDAQVLADQEPGMRSWVEQGFALEDVVRIFMLANGFVVGFCIEEQAVKQADDRQDYDVSARTERVGPREHPLTARAGNAIFGDHDAQFTAIVDLVVRSAAGLRAEAPPGTAPSAR
jgi:TetR/AcrR family tetracycline transcriptional repressor